MNPWFEKLFEIHGPPTPTEDTKDEESTLEDDEEEFEKPIKSLRLRNLVQLSNFVRDPEQHLFDAEIAYRQLRIDISKLRFRLCRMNKYLTAPEIGTIAQPSPTLRLFVRHQAAYGLVLTLAIVVNCIFRQFDPYNLELAEDSASFSEQVMALAKHASQYRPLGSGYIPMCLVAVWASTEDVSTRAKAEMMLAEYDTELGIEKWMEGVVTLQKNFQGIRQKLSTTRQGNGSGAMSDK